MSAFRVRAPGLALAIVLAWVSVGIAALESRWLGYTVLDALVIAILGGMLLRAALPTSEWMEPGIDFAAKELLEVAIILLGASVDLPALVRAGPALIAGILILVGVGLTASYGIGRALRLPHPLALLIACGNAICGNSAIAAVAPVIQAERAHVASAIAFTAVLGMVAVLGLPMLMGPLGFGDTQYGVLAGLTVYAVPQVIAAAFPVSVAAGQMATLVKLARVLLLGPVVVVLALLHRAGGAADTAPDRAPHEAPDGAARGRPAFRLTQFVPGFIVGFIALGVVRSLGLFPEVALGPTQRVSHTLTLVAMAGLGLGVDLRSLRRVGPKVAVATTLSLLVMVGIAVAVIRGFGLG
jgi:uncharacterized integral membrane protein (TIGR00698 family)